MGGAPQREPVVAYIGLGANLGAAAQSVRAAIAAVGGLPRTAVSQISSLYRSAPVDAGGPDYVNAVVEVRTALTAPALLAGLQQIEQGAGRTRPYRNAPRTLDLDLLLYGSATIASEKLVVPHPRLHARAFVLLPLAEIAPHLVPPAALAAVTSQIIVRIAPGADPSTNRA